MSGKEPHEKCILVVEDSYQGLVLITSLLEENGLGGKFRAVRDGVHAIEYLRARRRRVSDREPGVVFLDLQLPHKEGLEILRFMKSHPKLQDIPVIVFSNSNDPADQREAQRLGAHSFHIKPTRFEEFKEAFVTLACFWAKQLEKPPQDGQKCISAA